MSTVCFTGHRPDKLGGYNWNTTLNKIVIKALSHLVTNNMDKYKLDTFICGGALGVDMMAFEVCDALKENYNIKIILALPYPSQGSNWVSKIDKSRLESQIKRADELVYVSKDPWSAKKLQIRNEYMVDNSDVVISIWNGTKGGTCNCIEYAISKGLDILNFNPDTLKFGLLSGPSATDPTNRKSLLPL